MARPNSLHLILPYFYEQRWRIALGIVCLIAVDILQVAIPRVIKWAVDDLTGYRVDPAGLLTYAGYVLLIAVAIGVLRYIWRRCLIGTSRVVEEKLRDRLFQHLQMLSPAYYDRVSSGDLMAHATNDIQHIRMAAGMGLVALTDGIVLGLAAIGFMLYIDVTLTLFVLIPMPMIIFGTRLLGRRMHRAYQSVQGAFADMTETVREHFAGIRVVKAYTGESASTAELDRISRVYINENIKLVRVTGFFFPMMMLFSNLSLVIVLFLGGRLALDFTITPGDFVAFISYIGLLTWPMMAMGWVTNLIQRGKASLDRIDRILQTEPDIRDAPDAVPMPSAEGRVVFDAVSFSYPTSDRRVLTDISVSLEPGSSLGIVGPPGSGKSTLLRLIPRLYDVEHGGIRIDGTDVRRIRLADLRRQMAYVPQEPFLFSGTIRDNITAGAVSGGGDLVQATEAAHLRQTLDRFPEGWDTVVGEKGIMLSGGQKQRVAFARALMRPAPILLLDDPISQVDAATGDAIVRTIRERIGTHTVVIVSHRISALRFTDRIVVMEDGRIVARGTHDELMATDNFYSRTFRLQQIEEDAEATGRPARAEAKDPARQPG